MRTHCLHCGRSAAERAAQHGVINQHVLNTTNLCETLRVCVRGSFESGEQKSMHDPVQVYVVIVVVAISAAIPTIMLYSSIPFYSSLRHTRMTI